VERYICVHGHFYQPPRENPWLEVVERTEEAYPFHDWNERITAECYAPNTRARILDDRGRIVQLVNNYARLSFNIGPTLLSWMKDAAPETYADILAADVRSAERYGGHGSAMAQVYNHAIMPLASPRDRRTQVVWGVRDFQHRFGRDPEGMWLAETAVDDATLELVAEQGVRFVVLSPYQAARTRPIDGAAGGIDGEAGGIDGAAGGIDGAAGGIDGAAGGIDGETRWDDVRGGRVDPTMPYRVELASGRTLAVFFYDGPISQGVAFEGLLSSADRFERRLLEGFGHRSGPQLVNIATDGESYGHHHRHGEMALAATLERLAHRDDVRTTNYAQYLARFPPTHQAEVVQASSWSCSHGVERWRADCGCGGESGRHQRWRGPLRDALDELADQLARRYEDLAGELLRDPWAARDDYVEVVLDREGNLAAFLSRHTVRELTPEEVRRAVTLLEMQRYSLLMFTSCGWFFDELSRPEPVQVLLYAARAIQITRNLTGDDLEPAFVDALARAESNEPEYGDGRGIYEQLVRPEITGLQEVGAHFAISSLSWTYGRAERIGAYEVLRDVDELRSAGRAKLGYGRLTVRSVVTLNEAELEFGVLHLGDHNVVCGVRPRGDDAAYEVMGAELEALFDTADFPGLVRAIDHHLGGPPYSLRTLFKDEQQRILDTVLETTVAEVEASYRGIYRGRAPLMRFLSDLGASVPSALKGAAEIVINADLRAELSTTSMDLQLVRSSLDEAARYRIALDEDGLAHTLSASVARLATRVGDRLAQGAERLADFDEEHEGVLERVGALLEAVELVPFEVDLAPAQDVVWRALRDHDASLRARISRGDRDATRWLAELTRVAEAIDVVPPGPLPSTALDMDP
jgi:alpha-amylase/alpha-mannosidase (GH57 family)